MAYVDPGGDTKQKVAVIGAGPAGMTAAYQLSRKGVAVDVYEATDRVGGLAKSIPLFGQTVDLGPHRFFSNERRINEVWLEVMGRDYAMVDRLTRIFYRGKFFFYPLKPFDALWKVGFGEACRCFLSYLAARLATAQGEGKKTFEDWVVSRFGRRLFEIFFKTYSEKLWGIKCSELDAEFAAQRIKKLSLTSAIWNALVGGRGNKHKTLVDQFAYPKRGTGTVYERMAAAVQSYGGNIMLQQPVERVKVEGKVAKGVVLPGGAVREYDYVISTMPLTLMLKGLPDVPEKVKKATDQLRFRNTILVYLEVEAQNVFPDNWLYIHSPDLECGRVTNFSNWSKEITGNSRNTILCLEYWCNFEDGKWQETDANLIHQAKAEIKATGLIGDAKIAGTHVHKIPRCYPVYETGYKKHLDQVVEYLKSIERLVPIGRYGSFKYNNQDHSILMGIMAAENIADGRHHDLWMINTDDDYQEEATITAAGLQAESPALAPS